MTAFTYLIILPEEFLVFSLCLFIIFGVLVWPIDTSRVLVPFSFALAYERFCLLRIERNSLKRKKLTLGSGLLGEIQPTFSRLFRKHLLSTKDNLHLRTLIDGSAQIKKFSWLGIQTVLITIALFFGQLNSLNTEVYVRFFILDDFGVNIKILILLATAMILLLTSQQKKYLYSFELILLMLFAALGMLLLISSYNLLSLYLAIELQSFALYIVAALKRDSEFSTEAGLKYFILGAFASGFLLFGASLIYGFSGTLQFEELFRLLCLTSNDVYSENFSALFIITNPGILVGFVFIFSGLLFKLGAVPFHSWLPDVYEGSPLIVTCFFTIIPKITILSFCCRLLFDVFYSLPEVQTEDYFSFILHPILFFSALGSIFIGCFTGLKQKKIKRLLAFSAIGHVGYLLLGLFASSIEGVSAVFLYLIVYIITVLGLFTFLLNLVYVSNYENLNSTSANMRFASSPIYIGDLFAMAGTNPLLAVTFTVFLFSLAGIPPLAGFVSKLILFFATFNAGVYFLTTFAVLMSVVSCFFYIRLVKNIFFSLKLFNFRYFIFYTLPRENSLVLGFCLFFIIFLIFFPGPLFFFTHNLAFTFIF